jgi:hypothetical protein
MNTSTFDLRELALTAVMLAVAVAVYLWLALPDVFWQLADMLLAVLP